MALRVYKLILKDTGNTTGVEFVALVDKPAIEMTWQKFNLETPEAALTHLKFTVQDPEQHIITGPIMVAGMPIYRHDDHGEYYVYYDAPTIAAIVQRFFKNGNTGKVNLMHDDKSLAPGVYMIESFIINKDKGMNAPKGFPDMPDGSWFGSYKVDNDEIWQKFIRTGVFKGFSIEGMFIMQPTTMHLPNDTELVSYIVETLSQQV